MAKTVNLPDGRRVNFPDEYTADQIHEVIQRDLMPKSNVVEKPTGTSEDPFTDVKQIMMSKAEKLKNNSEAQWNEVKKGQKQAYSNQPIADKAFGGVGRVLYGSIPGVGNKDEMKAFDEASSGDLATGLGRGVTDVALTMYPGAAASKALKVGSIASPVLRAMASGAAMALPSAALHQSQNLAEGKGLNAKDAALEVGLSAAIPGLASGAGILGKKAANQITRTTLKSNAKIAGAKTLTSDQATRFLEDYGSLKGLKSSESLIQKTHESLNKEFDNLINQTASGKSVNLIGALKQAENEVDALAKNAGINLKDVPIIKKEIANFREQIKGITNKQGWSKFPEAQAYKTNTLGDIANYAKKSPGNFNPELSAQSQAARITRSKLSDQMANVEPKLKPLNKKFQDMAQVEPFVDAAIERGAANRGLSLQDIAALTGGALGIGGAAASDHEGLIPLALLPFLLSRGQKSTGLATALFRGGRSLSDRPSMLRDLMMQAARTANQQKPE